MISAVISRRRCVCDLDDEPGNEKHTNETGVDMNITVNGERVSVEEDLTVARLLLDRKVKMPDMVSVELNGKILARETFVDTAVRDGDVVEFLYFMGGGA